MRRQLLADLPRPLTILDAFGGIGALWRHCYDVPDVSGMVIEQHPQKAEVLAQQRPCWIVVEGDCVSLLRHGLGAWLPFDLLDLDAHGSPLACLEAVLTTPRALAPTLWVVATDGVGFALRRGSVPTVLRPSVLRYGRERLRRNYPAILHAWLEDLAHDHGRHLTGWHWRVAGSAGQLFHWMACLKTS